MGSDDRLENNVINSGNTYRNESSIRGYYSDNEVMGIICEGRCILGCFNDKDDTNNQQYPPLYLISDLSLLLVCMSNTKYYNNINQVMIGIKFVEKKYYWCNRVLNVDGHEMLKVYSDCNNDMGILLNDHTHNNNAAIVPEMDTEICLSYNFTKSELENDNVSSPLGKNY